MSQEVVISLNIAQMLMLGGLIWGLARMSHSVDTQGSQIGTLTRTLEKIGESLNDTINRVGVLEERTQGRRRADKGDR